MKGIIIQLIRTYKTWMRFPAIIMIAASCAYGTLYKDDEPDIPDMPLPEPPKMTISLNKSGEVSIEVFGAGAITIDWGDGKAKETHTISNNTSFRNVYSNANSRTITIAGANIMRLNCSGNKITQLNVSEITTLIHLFCSSNELENLDLSKNKNLLTIFCDDNKIKSLNVSANTALKTLYCNNNQITGLDLAKNTVLQTLKCSFNEMNAAALNALFETLHSNAIPDGKYIYIDGNEGAAGCNRSIAENKGWTVYDGSDGPTLEIEMITVTGGTFTMGSENSLDYYASPPHSVTLDSYSIGKYEVTQGQWWAVMGSWAGTVPSSGYGVGDNYPMYNVSWNDIVGTSSSTVGYTVNGITYYQNGFCYKLSQMLGDGKQYRLPTEAEWEYAARGGTATKNCTVGCDYSGSNTVGDVAWYNGNSGSSSHPVGGKDSNELGIYDMSGNVWEWCGDWWGSYTSASQTNPTGPTSGSDRVRRGGSWGNDAASARVARRGGYASGNRSSGVGFRLACSSN